MRTYQPSFIFDELDLLMHAIDNTVWQNSQEQYLEDADIRTLYELHDQLQALAKRREPQKISWTKAENYRRAI